MDLTASELEELKARDARFRAVDVAIQLRAELSEGRGLRLLLDAFEADAKQAMEIFADTSATDISAISVLQVRVRTYIMAQRSFGEVLLRGELAEVDLRNQDMEDH